MTLKQKAVAEKMVGSGGRLTVSEAMREVGYSENTIDTPTKLTESKGWKELMEDYLPDDEVFEAHRRGLTAKKWLTSHTEPDREVEDIPTQLKAVDITYKVKGYYVDKQVNILNNGEMSLQFTE